MRKKFYSQREFAKKAGISPQRLSELIQQGSVYMSDGGVISEDELEFFIRERLKKNIVNHRKSYVYITIGKTPKELADLNIEYAKNLATRSSHLTEVSSISEIISELKAHAFSEDIEENKLMAIDIKYKKAILKELIKRTQNAAFRLMNNFADTKTVGLIPAVSLYEMFMYNKLYTEDKVKEDEYYELLTSDALVTDSTTITQKRGSLAPLRLMEETYQQIIASLNLVDEQKKPLLVRSDLTPEIIKKIDAMSSNDLDIPDSSVLRKFFSKTLSINVKATKRENGSEALKILESVKDKALNAERLTKVSSICSNGFYAFFNITADTPEMDIIQLAADISDGYYRNVTILDEQESAVEKLPIYLLSAIDTSSRNRTALVRFSPTL